ncbi:MULTISPECIES: phage minor head protein [unclassified Psychrobacter]|uniref:phage head morphogenesis protein n=1 Tax=unclassified Psychrobacter TaxID=196806 RepID=UPI0018F6C987|nr:MULTISPECIES: phage minor head protein [unclassified Psychrobacter]
MPDSNVTLQTLFNRRPDDAIKYLQDKKPQASIDYAEIKGRAHDHAFVVAKMTDMDMLKQVQQSLVEAMENNMSFADWQASIKPTLQEKGWWGKKDIELPDGSIAPAQLGSDYRLKRIYETNINQAYHKAREHHGDYDIYPYAMWVSRGDNRVRPSHQSLDGQIFKRSDPYYQAIKPRKAWGCRCDEILLTAEQAAQYGALDGYTVHEDISAYVTFDTVIVQGTNGAYSAPVNILRLPDMPVYRTDAGWIHAGDRLPVQAMFDKAAQVPAMLGANSMQAVLARASVLGRVNDDVKAWVDSADTKRPKGEFRHVGVVRPEFINKLAVDKGLELENGIITLHDRVTLQHLDRAHKQHDPDWVANIVQHLNAPHSLYWDNNKQSPVLVFDVALDKYKLIVHLNERIKGRDVIDAKQNFVGNVIRTITVDTANNINNGNNYTKLLDTVLND